MTEHILPNEVLDADIAILGRKGGGKSYTAKGIVERLLDMGRRVLILDPLGVWAGLRTSADGQKPGYPVAIFGGEHGDMLTAAAKIMGAIDTKPARLFSWTQVAMLAGYSESGGQFRRGKKRLIETGTVVEEGGRVRIAKPTGKTPAPTGGDLVRFWREKLPGVGAAILARLWDAPGARHSLERVAANLNYAPTGGQFRRGVKALRDASIAESSNGGIALTSEFRELAGVR